MPENDDRSSRLGWKLRQAGAWAGAAAVYAAAQGLSAWAAQRQSGRGTRPQYSQFERPAFAPPGAVFPVVWSALNLTTATSAWRIWRAPGPVAAEPYRGASSGPAARPRAARCFTAPPAGCQPVPVTQKIRYCDTPAGRVAYSTTGTGPPLLFDSGWITHLNQQLDLFAFGAFVAGLAQRFTVIRYDKPGCGLSERDGIDLSFDGQVAAALTVADAVGARRFRLFGASQGGQIAASIAARHPERVESLALYGTCASGADLAPAEVRETVVALVRAHWGLGLKALLGAFVSDPTAEDLAGFTRFQRASATAAVAARLLEVYYETDVRALLPAIAAPTAVLHRQADGGTRFELGREVAALIPDATLIPLPGSSHLYYYGEWQAALDAALGFLAGPGDPGTGVTGPRLTGRELEVAELVAAGLTNGAIARRLSVAPRTAEAHVENIRRKLAVRSRAQIAAWVTEYRLRS